MDVTSDLPQSRCSDTYGEAAVSAQSYVKRLVSLY